MSDEHDAELDADLDEAIEVITGRKNRPRHQLTRFVILRGLGFIYVMSFWGATQQLRGLIGEEGLLPASLFVERLHTLYGGWAFVEHPTLFLAGVSDAGLLAVSWIGLLLGLAVMAGVTNAGLMAVLWALYLSVVHVGQTFYGYGWEILLLEAGFLAIFLCPLRSWRPLPREATPGLIVWLYRWLTFRVMFGAGLIKIRGDDCWRELTCLATHYETQPIPNPLSWWLHHQPLWFHQSGVLFNHVVELFVPFFFFGPWWLRWTGGALTIVFQGILILSGNLSFLNWLTIIVALSAFDDRLWERMARREPAKPEPPTKLRAGVVWAVFGLLCFMSVNPLMNMLSFDQRMNMSFDRLHLMNTYGAFGSINETRYEVILAGTADDPADPDATWLEYELPCKPGDTMRAPCVRAPYHHRLDWQLWFAGFRDYEHEPWIAHLAYQLLTGRGRGPELLDNDPFPNAPPRAVRASLYRYRFTRPGEEGWWRRERVSDYLDVLTVDDPNLVAFVESYGWPTSSR